jgi:hypothetical protein
MYGLAGFKNTPGMPDMNSRMERIMNRANKEQPGSYGKRGSYGKAKEKPTRHR